MEQKIGLTGALKRHSNAVSRVNVIHGNVLCETKAEIGFDDISRHSTRAKVTATLSVDREMGIRTGIL